MTMPGIRFGGAAGMLVALMGLSGAIASAADESPNEILEGHGLVKQGKYFLLPKVEDEVKEQLNKVVPLMDDLDVLFNQWSANEEKKFQLGALNDELAAVNAQKLANQALYSQLDRNPAIARGQRQQLDQNAVMLQNYFNQVQNQRNLVQSQIKGPRIQEAHLEKVAKAREVFLQAYDEMTPSLNKLKAAYNEVSQDAKVDSALKVLRESKRVQFKLGPSTEIIDVITRVTKAKQFLDPKVFQPKKFVPNKPPKKAPAAKKSMAK
jgi:hypothetical protein